MARLPAEGPGTDTSGTDSTNDAGESDARDPEPEMLDGADESTNGGDPGDADQPEPSDGADETTGGVFNRVRDAVGGVVDDATDAVTGGDGGGSSDSSSSGDSGRTEDQPARGGGSGPGAAPERLDPDSGGSDSGDAGDTDTGSGGTGRTEDQPARGGGSGPVRTEPESDGVESDTEVERVEAAMPAPGVEGEEGGLGEQAQGVEQDLIEQTPGVDDPDEVNVRREEDRLIAEPNERGQRAIREHTRGQVADENPAIEPDDLRVTREDGQFDVTIREDAQREVLERRADQLADEGASPDEIEAETGLDVDEDGVVSYEQQTDPFDYYQGGSDVMQAAEEGRLEDETTTIVDPEQEAREVVAADAGVEVDDVEFTQTDEGTQVTLSEEAQRERVAEDIEGVDAEDIQLTRTEGGEGYQVDISEEGQRDRIRQQVAAEREGVSPDEVAVEARGGQYVSGGDARLVAESGGDGDQLRQPTFDIEIEEGAAVPDGDPSVDLDESDAVDVSNTGTTQSTRTDLGQAGGVDEGPFADEVNALDPNEDVSTVEAVGSVPPSQDDVITDESLPETEDIGDIPIVIPEESPVGGGERVEDVLEEGSQWWRERADQGAEYVAAGSVGLAERSLTEDDFEDMFGRENRGPAEATTATALSGIAQGLNPAEIAAGTKEAGEAGIHVASSGDLGTAADRTGAVAGQAGRAAYDVTDYAIDNPVEFGGVLTGGAAVGTVATTGVVRGAGAARSRLGEVDVTSGRSARDLLSDDRGDFDLTTASRSESSGETTTETITRDHPDADPSDLTPEEWARQKFEGSDTDDIDSAQVFDEEIEIDMSESPEAQASQGLEDRLPPREEFSSDEAYQQELQRLRERQRVEERQQQLEAQEQQEGMITQYEEVVEDVSPVGGTITVAAAEDGAGIEEAQLAADAQEADPELTQTQTVFDSEDDMVVATAQAEAEDIAQEQTVETVEQVEQVEQVGVMEAEETVTAPMEATQTAEETLTEPVEVTKPVEETKTVEPTLTDTLTKTRQPTSTKMAEGMVEVTTTKETENNRRPRPRIDLPDLESDVGGADADGGFFDRSWGNPVANPEEAAEAIGIGGGDGLEDLDSLDEDLNDIGADLDDFDPLE